MPHPLDPGWRRAPAAAWRILTGGPQGTILEVMRAAVVLLGTVAVVAALGALMAGAGTRDPVIGSTSARLALSGALAVAVVGMSLTGTGGPDVDGPDHLAIDVFRITMRRVLFAAALGPAGLAISWLAGDGSYVVFGTGLALLFMAVSGPTEKRLRQFQVEVGEAGSDLDVVEALQRSFR